VVRSPRRRKTVQARQVDGVLRIAIPADMSRADEERWVAELTTRFERRVRSAGVDLVERTAELATRLGLPAPRSVTWVDNQRHRWGSCTPSTRALRISDRVAAFPPWVLDYVLVHELAHLVEANHSRPFWDLVNRYPRAERARGYLIAKGGEDPVEPATPSRRPGSDQAGLP